MNSRLNSNVNLKLILFVEREEIFDNEYGIMVVA